MRDELLAIVDELLAGAHPDLNSPELARELGRLGITVQHVEIVRDDEEAIATAVTASLARASLLIVTGGLGPTQDDVTRHGIARAFGRELETSAVALDGLKDWFERRGTDMPVANERQALIPEGADLVLNRRGTAPGFRIVDGERAVVSLPGPPPEMRVVLAEELAPWLVSGQRGVRTLRALIDGAFASDCMQMQVNVIDPTALVEARDNPGRYPGLLVRVSGYSAYFDDLSREMKEEIIARTVYELEG